MLIVNADDLGRDRESTDRALSCFQSSRITSASAMVFMADSERAARLARDAGLDVGLHLNLSDPFTSEDVPVEIRRAQQRLCRFLRASKYSLLLYRPSLRDVFRRVYAAQHREFLRLYGHEPSHVDGHQHMHLATNVLVQRLLPAGAKVRRSFSFAAGEKSFINRWYRAFVDAWLARRYQVTDYFFSLSQNLTEVRIERLVSLAANADVELMTHPQVASEFEFIMSKPFERALSRAQLVSYGNYSTRLRNP